MHAHGDDFALEVAFGGVPLALVDDELPESMVTGVLVGFADDPGGGVADAYKNGISMSLSLGQRGRSRREGLLTKIQNLALIGRGVEGLHDLWDRRGPVPPVHVKDVDVARLELLQAGFEADVQGLGVIARVVGVQGLGVGAVAEAGRVLPTSSIREEAFFGSSVLWGWRDIPS